MFSVLTSLHSVQNVTLSAQNVTLSAQNVTLSAQNVTLSAQNVTLSAQNVILLIIGRYYIFNDWREINHTSNVLSMEWFCKSISVSARRPEIYLLRWYLL